MGVTESHNLKQEIRKILDCQVTAAIRGGVPAAEPSPEFETWRLVHNFVHAPSFFRSRRT